MTASLLFGNVPTQGASFLGLSRYCRMRAGGFSATKTTRTFSASRFNFGPSHAPDVRFGWLPQSNEFRFDFGLSLTESLGAGSGSGPNFVNSLFNYFNKGGAAGLLNTNSTKKPQAVNQTSPQSQSFLRTLVQHTQRSVELDFDVFLTIPVPNIPQLVSGNVQSLSPDKFSMGISSFELLGAHSRTACAFPDSCVFSQARCL